MKITYYSATIGFCFDLTNPNAKSLPVATLVVGSAEAVRYAAVSALVPARPGKAMDPISFEVLTDVPNLIKDHVDAVLHALPPDATVDQILTKLHRGLRNSLHVERISDARTLDAVVDAPSEVERDRKIATQLSRIADEEMDAALAGYLRTTQSVGHSTSPSQERRMPSQLSWPLPPVVREVRA